MTDRRYRRRSAVDIPLICEESVDNGCAPAQRVSLHVIKFEAALRLCAVHADGVFVVREAEVMHTAETIFECACAVEMRCPPRDGVHDPFPTVTAGVQQNELV